MGNTPVNCGCFDNDVDKLKESNCLDPRNRPLQNNSLYLNNQKNTDKLYNTGNQNMTG